MRQGALAPPVLPDVPPSAVPSSTVPSPVVPPVASSVDSGVASSAGASVPPSTASTVPSVSSPLPVVSEPLAAEDVLAVVVVFFVAWLSAELSFGGVISGVLFGVDTETLALPQALRPTEASSSPITLAKVAARDGRLNAGEGPVFTSRAGSCGARTSGSRSGPFEMAARTMGRDEGSRSSMEVATARGRGEAACPQLPSVLLCRGRGRSRPDRPRPRSRARLRGCEVDIADVWSRPGTLPERAA